MEQSTQKYQVGDQVKLKSGGPEMTVSVVFGTDDPPSYRCQWFSGKKLEQGTFHGPSLLAVEPKADV